MLWPACHSILDGAFPAYVYDGNIVAPSAGCNINVVNTESGALWYWGGRRVARIDVGKASSGIPGRARDDEGVGYPPCGEAMGRWRRRSR